MKKTWWSILKYFKKNQNSSNSSEGKIKMMPEKIEGTPFVILKDNEKDIWFIAFGTYKIKESKNKKELYDYLNDNMYNVMCDIVIIINEMKEKQNELAKQKTN